MKEEYLHHIWRMKRLPVSNMLLSDGREVKIINTGWHNPDSGPDFFNGSIEIDGIRWNGNIEIHVKSSDWYLHKHQFDEAYKNVILHVVYQNDKELFIDEQKIPTLELKKHIDKDHCSNYERLLFNSAWIPCENSIQKVDKQVVLNQIENAAIDRLDRKNELLKISYEELKFDLLGLYFEIYAKAFGLKVNNLPFIELTKRIDLKTCWKVSEKQTQILFLGVAGFFQQDLKFNLLSEKKEWKFLQKKYNLSEMSISSWKFKGIRPPSFPNLKIVQFANLCSNKDFFSILNLDVNQIIALFQKMNFSSDFQLNLLINAVIPIFWWDYKHFQNENSRQKSIDLLQETKSENNQIISKWKNLGIKSKSSFDSQGLLELKNELCAKTKCLTCKIGFSVLNN